MHEGGVRLLGQSAQLTVSWSIPETDGPRTDDGQFSSNLRLDGRSRCSYQVAAGDTRLEMPARTTRTAWPAHGEYQSVCMLGILGFVWVLCERVVPSKSVSLSQGHSTCPPLRHPEGAWRALFMFPLSPWFRVGALFAHFHLRVCFTIKLCEKKRRRYLIWQLFLFLYFFLYAHAFRIFTFSGVSGSLTVILARVFLWFRWCIRMHHQQIFANSFLRTVITLFCVEKEIPQEKEKFPFQVFKQCDQGV